jgi:GT2 family glycosyltransferase
MKSKSVFVIILNWNHLDDLKETIASFVHQDYSNLHIVVSDNGSTDGSVEWLKKSQSDIIILENKANLGWAEGNNVGIKYALDKNADYILLANNDISFDDSSIISNLIDSYSNISNLGIIGPKQNSFYSPDKTVNEGWILFPNSKYIFNKYRLKNSIKPIESNFKIVDNVSGSFMIIKREVFEDVGEIDSALFLYAEDADFCIRAWKKKWISVVDKEVTILHKISATSVAYSPLKIYYKTRNLIYFIKKHSDVQSSHGFFIRKYYLDFVIKSTKILCSSDYSNNRIAKLRANILGLYHGAIIKRMNKYY